MKSKIRMFLTPLLVLFFSFALAQDKTITGNVTDQSGMPLPGVSVLIVGSTTGTQTDFDGNYTINASEGQQLRFSYIGQKTTERLVGASNTINVQLQEDAQALDEVVVVGYGVQRKRDLTAAISTIKGEEIANLITPSFEAQLAGRAAGVQITTQSGIIGERPRIRIRGIASISSGTFPLVVVDGIPIFTGESGGYADTNPLAEINPADIESFDVLKDGAATAIYGSRAANGVILITTKRGKEGTVAINYNTSVGFASPIRTFDLLKAQDFITINNEKRTNRNQGLWAAGTDFETDWQAAVLNNNAFQQDHNLSFSGGTKNTQFFTSVGYNDLEAVARPNSQSRFSFRSNIDQKIKSWLNVGVSAGFTRTETFGLNTGTNSLSGNIFNAMRQHPNVAIFDANDPTGYNLDDVFPDRMGRGSNLETIGDNLPNIRFVLDNNQETSRVNRLIGNVYMDIKPFSTVNFRTQVSIDNTNANGFLYWSPTHGDGFGSNGRVQNNFQETVNWNWQNVLSYNETYGEDHNVSATLINEYQKRTIKSFFGSGTDLSNEFFNQNLVSGTFGVQGSGGGFTDNGIISFAGRLNYNYKQKYFIQGSLRRDGLSSLPQANKYGVFPGASVGWTVSKENFMQGLENVVSDFKIRGSYGKVGNTEIGNYPYFGLYGSAQYGNNNGIAYVQFGNNNLLWETSEKIDIGADLSLFQNKFSLAFDYFRNTTDDLILALETPQSFGIPSNSYDTNIGKVENSGIEFAANAVLFDKDFKWNVSANISFVDNEVQELVNGQDRIGTNTITREGESINSIYGYRYGGVNAANGNPIYFKADGTRVQALLPGASFAVYDEANPADVSVPGSISAITDREILGQSLPKYFGGFNSNMSYKNFDLGFLFRFSGGNKIFNATRRELLNTNFTNNGTEILGRWQSVDNPGDGVTPRLYALSNTTSNLTSVATSRFLEDGDFIRLDNITLGYSLPKTITEQIGISKMRMFVQAQNVWVITNYRGLDPEQEAAGVDLNGTPISSVFSFGLNVGF
ncbi:TonB-dependent receptor [Cellulophaga sp. Hel_I_12]|uniref:SusC/RagA family TonB-linked outer membrane protein n=1 Tax=Cellulophaga sp. Hel_I_12 TaxID=1249972 RepID=UPI000646E129|nr:TonB-dependent receptor [Cellulophaga sp. Hel_I_12]